MTIIIYQWNIWKSFYRNKKKKCQRIFHKNFTRVLSKKKKKTINPGSFDFKTTWLDLKLYFSFTWVRNLRKERELPNHGNEKKKLTAISFLPVKIVSIDEFYLLKEFHLIPHFRLSCRVHRLDSRIFVLALVGTTTAACTWLQFLEEKPHEKWQTLDF